MSGLARRSVATSGRRRGTSTPAAAESVFATSAQIGSLSTTSAAALRAKAIADDVKGGVITAATATISDWLHVDNKIAGIALTTALWWKRTGDSTYLQPLKDYLLGVPKPPGAVQALNPVRALGGYFAAVDILKKNGQWDMAALLPNHNNISFQQFVNGDGGTLLPLHTRILNTGGGRWSQIRGTDNKAIVNDSASNWGGVGRWAHLMWAVVAENQAEIDHSVLLMKKWLGDTTTGLPDYKSSGDYLKSWDNWNGATNVDGTNQPLAAGVGKTDANHPGLDGVIINDIDRGANPDNYDPTLAFYGAKGPGLTYPLENVDGVYPQLAAFRNMGYPVATWGEGGNALARMNARFARIRSGDTLSLFDNAEGVAGLYKNFRWVASRLSADANYGTKVACPSGTGGLPRCFTYGDWLCEAGTTWGA